jgi:hypothetical protein
MEEENKDIILPGERNEGTKSIKGRNPFLGGLGFLAELIYKFKAGMIADSGGRIAPYQPHPGRGHFKQNQRIERKLSRRRRMKSSAR